MPRPKCPGATEALLKTRAQLDEKLAACKAQLKTVSRAEKAGRQQLAEYVQGARIMLCRWDGDIAAVRCWMQAIGGACQHVDDIIKAAAKEHTTEADDGLRERLRFHTPLPKCCTTKRAEKIAAEYTLYAWLQKQNMMKALAPTSFHVLRQRAADPKLASQCRTQGNSGSRKQWVRRWRRRWGVQLARFATRETMSEEMCQKKDCGATCC